MFGAGEGSPRRRSSLLQKLKRRGSGDSIGRRSSFSSCGSGLSADDDGENEEALWKWTNLIHKRQWKKMRKRLKRNRKVESLRKLLWESCATSYIGTANSSSPTSNRGATQQESLLHVLCRHHPPLDVVDLFCGIHPPSVSQPNSLRRTPLHVAVAHGASSKVIKCLLSHCADAASMKDSQGRTPLHLACGCCPLSDVCDPGFGSGDDEDPYCRGPFLSVIIALYAAAPRTVNFEDNDDCTPLELAILNNAALKVVKLLQKLSMYQWKLERKMQRRIVSASPEHHVTYACCALLYVKEKFEDYDEEVPWEESQSVAASGSAGTDSYYLSASDKRRSRSREDSIIDQDVNFDNNFQGDDADSTASSQTIGSDIGPDFVMPMALHEFLPSTIWENSIAAYK